MHSLMFLTITKFFVRNQNFSCKKSSTQEFSPYFTLSITLLQNSVLLNVFSKKTSHSILRNTLPGKNMRLLMDCLLFETWGLNHKRFNIHRTQIWATAVNCSLALAIHSGYTCSQNHWLKVRNLSVRAEKYSRCSWTPLQKQESYALWENGWYRKKNFRLFIYSINKIH